jgi:hypothetical protein
MADDVEPTPAPRPRRRRTDVDPTVKARRLPHGRRRSDLVPDIVLPAVPVVSEAVVEEPQPPTADDQSAAAPIADAPVAEVPPGDPPTTRFLDPGAVLARARGLPADPTRSSDRESWLPMIDERSPDPGVCPFLRAVRDDDLVAPIETPDAANRCAALREAVPQSLRQQELVCLESGHVNCPRYLRGAVVVAETPEPVVASGMTVTPAVLGSLVVLVMAFSLSVAFVMARGGMELATVLPTASPAPSSTTVAVASVAPTVVATAIPTAIPTAPPTPSPSATPSPTPSPTPTPTAKPTAKPTPKATPRPTSDRYALLRPCPGTPDCWIYRVRAGDNLFSIANYFGVSLDSIYAMNPWVRNGLRPGQELRLPPPTR